MKEFSEKELLLLGYLEGDLSDSEKAKFEAMMAEDAALMAEYRQLERTKLPMQQITYANKASLKRTATPPQKKPVLGYILWPVAVAASIALLFWFISPNANINGEITAANTSHTTIQTPGTTEKQPNTTEIVETTKDIKGETLASTEVEQVVPKTIKAGQRQNAAPKGGSKNQSEDVKTFSKQSIKSGELLASKTVSIKTVKSTIPIVETVLEIGNEDYVPYTASAIDEKGWLARTTHRINNQLGTWVGYVQKPQVDINKKEEANGGRTYWAITLETEKYEWEGRLLYTHR